MAAITATAIALGVGAVGSIVAGSSQASGAKRREREAADRVRRLEANRQEIIDPSEFISDLSGGASNVYSSISNPFANLSVSTEAAKFQSEEADLSLATALDTLRSTGAGAGGATAIAQMALKSKAGVSADIAAQESTNARLRAQGEMERQLAVARGEERLQNIGISEGQRVQGARAGAAQWMFGVREEREMQQLNRAAGQQDNAAQQRAQGNAAMWGGVGQLTGALTAIATTPKGTDFYGN